MQQRLAAAQGDDAGFEIAEQFESMLMTSSGTGFEKSSYSLQYVQERLQRRMGMMCAMIG